MTINIIDELTKIKNDSGHIINTIEKLYVQQEETKKQLYLFKVLNLVHKFEDMIKNNIFEKAGICTADMSISVNEDIGNIIRLSPYDKDGLYVDDCYYAPNKGIVSIQEVVEINDLFLTLNGLNREHINEDFKNNKVYHLTIEEGCTKIIQDALLSKELKTIIEYSEMQVELNNKNENANKKMKM
jgi:thymidine kinase